MKKTKQKKKNPGPKSAKFSSKAQKKIEDDKTDNFN